MGKPTKFGEVGIGETFTIRRYTALKIDGTRYKVMSGGESGVIQHTTANALVNGSSSLDKQRAKQHDQWQSLNNLAQSVGYATWSQLEKAALKGARIELN